MFTNKKRLILSHVSVNLGCGSCKKPNLSEIFQPTQKGRAHKTFYSSPSASSSKVTNLSSSPNEYDTPSTFSPDIDSPPRSSSWDRDADSRNKLNRFCRKTTVRGLGRVGGESVAVEKDSDDPYLDFQQSMLQMILEKEIYSRDDLKELLNCFLQLNPPDYHGIIVKAFTEIWNGVFSVRSTVATAVGGGGSSEKLLRHAVGATSSHVTRKVTNGSREGPLYCST